MLSDAKATTAVLLSALLVASGIAVAAGASAPTSTAESDARDSTGLVTAQDGSTSVQVGSASAQTGPANAQESDEAANASACAATPPADHADPDSDGIGWEDGYWYDETLDVSQDDGLADDERDAVVARTMARVEAIRCVEFDESVPVSVISREQFRQSGALGQDVPEELRAFDNVKFESLLLVDEETDSIAVQRENQGTGVLGFYSPQQDEIVVVAEDAETLRLDEITLAHELVHAWQDQQFDLQSAPLDARLRDDANARNGLVEGDASYVDRLYQRQCRQGWDCLEGRTGPTAGGLANTGVYMLQYQPYSDGPSFVRMAENLGGWDAVNDLYENPPASSEQVIHPQRYGADEPTNVTLNDSTSEAWNRIRPPDRPDYGEVGEAGLMSMFVFPYYDSGGQTEIVPSEEWFNQNQTGNVSDFDPLNYESVYSEGWDGDRLHAYESDSGEYAYVWRLAWDSPQDAEQFVEGYEQVLRYWGGQQIGPNAWRIDEGGFADAFHVDVNETTVTIVNAPTVDQLSEVNTDVEPVVRDGQADEPRGTTTADGDAGDDGATDNATLEISTTDGELSDAAEGAETGNETTTAR